MVFDNSYPTEITLHTEDKREQGGQCLRRVPLDRRPMKLLQKVELRSTCRAAEPPPSSTRERVDKTPRGGGVSMPVSQPPKCRVDHSCTCLPRAQRHVAVVSAAMRSLRTVAHEACIGLATLQGER